jgi:peptide chain release factor 3
VAGRRRRGLQGLIDRRNWQYTRFTRTARGASAAAEETSDVDVASEKGSAEHGTAWKAALDECSLLEAIGADLDLPSFLDGHSTPVFIGSALTNFGVRLLLDAVVDMAPSPSPRVDRDGTPRPLDSPFSAFVFKVQANMDPAHRDRIAFARVCSGRFDRGMSVTNHRTGRDITTKYATTAFGPDRETVEEAFPGDVVGLVNASGVQLGDTLYDAGYAGLAVEYPPIPRFSPEVFAKARPVDNGRFKQFRKGLAQLDEEGVVQVLRDPDFGESETILAGSGRAAVRGLRLPAGQRVRRADRDPLRAVPGDPPHRQGVERASPSHRRDPHPHPRRRCPWWRCSRTAIGCNAWRATSPS